MPRKKPEPAAPAVVTVTPAPASIPVDDAPTAWSTLLQDLGPDADVSIDVYAEPERGQGGAEWVCSVNAADFPQLSDLLTYVKAHPDGGPGLYSLRMKQGGKFRGAPRVRIAGRRPPPLPPGAVPAQPPAPAVDVLAEMRAMQQRADERYMGLLEKLIPARNDGTAQFTNVIEAARLLAPTKERTPISDLKELLSLLDLQRGKRDEGGEGAGGADAGDDWLTATIKTFGPAIVAQATAPAAPPPRPPQIAPPAPAPIVVNPAGVATPPPRPAPPPQAPANPLAPLLGLLIRGASSDGDPAAYASVALDLLGDYAPMLISRPDALDQLMAMAPAAVEHRAWFAELLQAAREMLAQAEADDDEEPPQGGGLTGAETGPDGPGHVGPESAPVP